MLLEMIQEEMEKAEVSSEKWHKLLELKIRANLIENVLVPSTSRVEHMEDLIALHTEFEEAIKKS